MSFQKGDWPISGEMIPDLVALTMGFSVKEVLCFLTQQLTFFFFLALSFILARQFEIYMLSDTTKCSFSTHECMQHHVSAVPINKNI